MAGEITTPETMPIGKREAAHAIGCSSRTIDRLVASGEIPSVVFRHRLIPWRGLREFIESGRQTGHAGAVRDK
jgi:excisionase family DNA binding protein